MMKVFLDTNVFLDMLTTRENRTDNENALMILRLSRTDAFHFCISPLTVATCFYCLRKKADCTELIKDRLTCIGIEKMEGKDVEFAIQGDFPDREDAMQMSCARNSSCDLILTRDIKHFASSPLPVMAPSEFLARVR